MGRLVRALEARFAMGVGPPGWRMAVNYSTIRQPSGVELSIVLSQGDTRIADFTETSAVIYDKVWYDKIVELLNKVQEREIGNQTPFTVYSININD